MVIAAITVAELLVGIELADEKHRAGREAFLTDVLVTVPVEDYTVDVATAHARLLAHTAGSVGFVARTT